MAGRVLVNKPTLSKRERAAKALNLLGHHLMSKHKMYEKGWTFHIDWRVPKKDARTRRLGFARSEQRQIVLFGWEAILGGKEEAIDTILHEIAHALQYDLTGEMKHNSDWRALCEIVGAVPERLARPRKERTDGSAELL